MSVSEDINSLKDKSPVKGILQNLRTRASGSDVAHNNKHGGARSKIKNKKVDFIANTEENDNSTDETYNCEYCHTGTTTSSSAVTYAVSGHVPSVVIFL